MDSISSLKFRTDISSLILTIPLGGMKENISQLTEAMR